MHEQHFFLLRITTPAILYTRFSIKVLIESWLKTSNSDFVLFWRALIDALDVPVVGGLAESRYLSMDKLKTRGVLLANRNVSIAEGIVYNKGNWEVYVYACLFHFSIGESLFVLFTIFASLNISNSASDEATVNESVLNIESHSTINSANEYERDVLLAHSTWV